MNAEWQPVDPHRVRKGERVRVTTNERGVTATLTYTIDQVHQDATGTIWDLPDGSTRYWDPTHPYGSPAALTTVEVFRATQTRVDLLLRDVVNGEVMQGLLPGDAFENAGKWRFLEGALNVLDDAGLLRTPGARDDMVRWLHKALAERYPDAATEYNGRTAEILADIAVTKGT